jgi:biotin operon repressor
MSRPTQYVSGSPSNLYGEPVANAPAKPETGSMSDLNREEVKARLEASEAKMATSVEGLRADGATLRADVNSALAEIRAQGDRAQASADKFYSEAGRLLAEIRLAGEQNKTAVMGMGYKIAAWLFGAIVAVASLSLAIYKAVSAAVS